MCSCIVKLVDALGATDLGFVRSVPRYRCIVHCHRAGSIKICPITAHDFSKEFSVTISQAVLAG